MQAPPIGGLSSSVALPTRTVDATASMTYPSRTPTHSASSSAIQSTSMSSAGAGSQQTGANTPKSLSAQRTENLYLGIVFGSIAGLAILAAIIACCLKIRDKRRAEENAENWPWDRDDRRVEEGFHHQGNDTDLGQSHLDSWGYPHSNEMSAKSRELIEQLPQPPALWHPPDGRRYRGGEERSLNEAPRSPQSLRHKAYPTIQIHHAHQSVPDLAPDLGKLKVANYMPGDASSFDEASRAGSRLGTASELGTSSPNTPKSQHHATPDPGDGWSKTLGSPWAPLQVRHSSSPRVRLQDPGQKKLPDDSQRSNDTTADPASSTSTLSSQETWASSIRSNIVNAFNAVVGSNTPQVDDNLTRAPLRTVRRLDPSQSKPLREVFPVVDMDSKSQPSGSKLPPLATGSSSVGSEVVSLPWASEVSLSDGDIIKKPLPAMIRSQDRSQIALPPVATSSNSGSVYSEESAASVERTTSMPPQLPQIPPMSRTSTSSSSWCSYDPPRKSLKHQSRQSRKKSSSTVQNRRPTLMAYGSSSTYSAYSGITLDSAVTRSSSTSSGSLNDQELFAKMALKERRKRLLMNRERSPVGRSIRRRGTRMGSIRASQGEEVPVI